ncbi:MAG: zinc-ribbon domain-containing protein [Nitrosopumilus sp.]|nr:zinc-ribbon domain-containing protein [Nitrosopumilus sp.]
MSSELRLKKLRGSGGYVMATVTDEQQMKGNLGGPDLFLAPIGRLDVAKITKYFCNTCEKEFEGSPKIEFDNSNEEVAENLVLAEKGQYICNSCNASIAEYREFKKQDETGEIGSAKPIVESAPQVVEPTAQTPQEIVTQPDPVTSVSSIEGRTVIDENANKIGVAKQVGIDSTQSMVLVLTKNDGTEGSIPWNNIKKIGEVILLGNPEAVTQPGKCSNCGFGNKEGSKFCEECGTQL